MSAMRSRSRRMAEGQASENTERDWMAAARAWQRLACACVWPHSIQAAPGVPEQEGAKGAKQTVNGLQRLLLQVHRPSGQRYKQAQSTRQSTLQHKAQIRHTNCRSKNPKPKPQPQQTQNHFTHNTSTSPHGGGRLGGRGAQGRPRMRK